MQWQYQTLRFELTGDDVEYLPSEAKATLEGLGKDSWELVGTTSFKGQRLPKGQEINPYQLEVTDYSVVILWFKKPLS